MPWPCGGSRRAAPSPSANSYTYDTWGTPTTATHNSIPDLSFRFLYVGEYDVAWDNLHGLGLLYMHARHYAPSLGRFLQPDPDGSEANLYAYTANNPVTELDPDGTCLILCAIVNAALDTAIYLATTDNPTLEGAAGAAAFGAVTGALGVGLLTKVTKIGAVANAVSRIGKAASKIISKVPKATRGVSRVARSGNQAGHLRLGSVAKRLKQIEWRGGEIRFSANFRIQPGLRLRAKSWAEKLPHYHRRGPTDLRTGKTLPGQGIGRHRPWESSGHDRRFRDRL
jgi:RHS repeat-associated protein